MGNEISMPLVTKTIPKEHLVKDSVYRLYHRETPSHGYIKKELAVFCHIGQTGMPIFHPLGEPSFQDVFGLEDYENKWLVIFEREGTQDDVGY